MNDLADFALNAVWQSGIVALAALAAAHMMRRASGRARHALLVAALLACTAVLFGVRRPQSPLSYASPKGKAATGPAALETFHIAIESPPVLPAEPVAFAYLLLLAHAVFTLARASWRAHAVRRSATGFSAQAERILASLGARDVPVRTSAAIASPATVGAFRPLIVLPASVSEDALLPVLAHELAHIRRRDALVQLLVEIVTLPVAFHPLVRLLKREAAVAREIACDQFVAPTIVAPRYYAQTLLSLATPQPHAIAFGDVAALELRLLSLRDGEPRRTRRIALIAAAALLAVIALGASFLRFDLFGGKRHAELDGRWQLDVRATDFGVIPPYQSFTQTLARQRRVFRSWQTRVRDGKTQRIQWRIEADGVARPLRVGRTSGTGVARWDGDALVIEMSLRNGHWERTRATLGDHGNTLICAGEVRERGRGGKFRLVFRRQS